MKKNRYVKQYKFIYKILDETSDTDIAILYHGTKKFEVNINNHKFEESNEEEYLAQFNLVLPNELIFEGFNDFHNLGNCKITYFFRNILNINVGLFNDYIYDFDRLNLTMNNYFIRDNVYEDHIIRKKSEINITKTDFIKYLTLVYPEYFNNIKIEINETNNKSNLYKLEDIKNELKKLNK